jgi:demethylmenaquinone methyltransferase/2-methoxy-6-polyprenyl-1,4-benzoquinol methylase
MPPNRFKLDIVYRFFSGTGLTYDRVVVVCTCGLDKLWKKRIVEEIPVYPTRILDQGCGTGILTMDIAWKFPGCGIVGVELRDEYLSLARQKALSAGLKNIQFILGRAEDVSPEGSFDCIISSYLAKYADLPALAANARKMLRPGGVMIMHDFTVPSNPVFLSIWNAYFLLLRTLGGRIWPEWRTVFLELPEFLRQCTWTSEAFAALEKNDFCDISIKPLNFGASAIITARKRGPQFHRTSG